MDSRSLLAILRLPFRCLESFSIDLWFPSIFSGELELKSMLSNIIHSSTLETLYFNNVSPLPLLGVHLRTLTLEGIWPNEIRFEKSDPSTLAASENLAFDTVIDQCI